MFNPRNPLLTDVALLLLRLVVGVVFIYHGGQKLFGKPWFDGMGMAGFTDILRGLQIPNPVLMAWLAAISEFAGGTLVLIGFFTRLAAIPLIVTMGMAIYHVHPDQFSGKDGMEFPLTLGVVLVAILLSGPGRFSFDRLVWPTLQRRRAQRQFKAQTRAEIEAEAARDKKP
ncbi:MAG: DoxX family protein [Planctomycetales bacterium]